MGIPGPRICIELLTARFVKERAVIVVTTALGRELNIRATLRTRVSAQPGGFNRDLFDRPESHRNRGEEDGAAALETIRGIIDAVNCDVDCSTGKVVIPGATSSRRHCPGCQPGQSKYVGTVIHGELRDGLRRNRIGN